MKHFVAISTPGGEVELHRMKPWLRRNAAELPRDFPLTGTSRQMRRALLRSGWRMREGENDVRLFRPGDEPSMEGDPALSSPGLAPARKLLAGERAWVRSLVPALQAALKATDPALEVRDGYRLAYSREILSYDGAEAKREAGMRYETDLLIVERVAGGWTPRVVVEAKLRRVTTHDAITYSQKAATHKHVHPYLRYGIFLGERKHHPLPGRLFRHGAHFDFMLSWKELEASTDEFEAFIRLLIEEVNASRLLQDIMFNSRSRSRTGYTLLHRPVIAR